LVQQLVLHEGESLTVYTDTVGVMTIGVGHNLRNGISQRVSRVMLDEDIDEAVQDLARFKWFGVMNSVRQRAMIDFRFNLGPTKFREFVGMLAALDRDDYTEAAKHMLHSHWAAQVKSRRAVKLARMVETGTE